MKSAAALGKATRTVGKLFFVLTLLLIAVVGGFGGTALFVYHEFNVRPVATGKPTRGIEIEHRTAAGGSQADQEARLRSVAALPSDQPRYVFADHRVGGTTEPQTSRPQSTNVPAPLDMPAQASDSRNVAVPLNDPESHYIIDSRTGRVVGIDGSVGARLEQVQEESVQVQTAAGPVVAQMPAPEVRVASAVVEDGRPVFDGTPLVTTSAIGSQYVPVRKALPVDSNPSDAQPSTFNAAEFMVSDDDRPVLRAQPVVPSGARAVKTVRVYRLPDGSQTVAAE